MQFVNVRNHVQQVCAAKQHIKICFYTLYVKKVKSSIFMTFHFKMLWRRTVTLTGIGILKSIHETCNLRPLLSGKGKIKQWWGKQRPHQTVDDWDV